MYAHILVPVDGSHASNAALTAAIELAKTLKSSLRLVHVVNEYVFVGSDAVVVNYGEIIESIRETGKRILETALVRAREAGLQPESALLESIGGRAADLIIEQAKDWADLIVMGTHGRRGVARLVMGSDSERVIHATPVPVLLVRSEER